MEDTNGSEFLKYGQPAPTQTLVERYDLRLNYKFDPELDVILFADQLTDGMTAIRYDSSYEVSRVGPFDKPRADDTEFSSPEQEKAVLKECRWFEISGYANTKRTGLRFIATYSDGEQIPWKPMATYTFVVRKDTINSERVAAAEKTKGSGGLHIHIHLPNGLETVVDYDGDLAEFQRHYTLKDAPSTTTNLFGEMQHDLLKKNAGKKITFAPGE